MQVEGMEVRYLLRLRTGWWRGGRGGGVITMASRPLYFVE